MSISDMLGTVTDWIGTATEAAEFVEDLDPELSLIVAQAESYPTSANVEAVATAYARRGKVPPAKLMAHLLIENEKRYPGDTVRGDLAPWLIGGVVLFLLLRRKR